MNRTLGTARVLVLVVASCVTVFGLAVRVSAFVHHRALGIDEVMLALNLTTRSYAELLRPLAFEQTAPILFLWASKASVLVWGVDERTLRAGPFIAGLALIPLVWYVGRRLLFTAEGAALAAAAAAVCPIAMAYADVFKPYAVDATIGALLTLLTLRVVDAPDRGLRWWSLGAACCVGAVLSAPSVFITAAAMLAIAMSPAFGTPDGRRRLTTLAVVWAAAAGANLGLLQRSTVQNAYMQRYWDGAFFRPPIWHMGELLRARIGWTIQELFLGETVPYAAGVRGLLVGLALGGLFLLARRHGRWLPVLLVGPSVGALMSSALRLYPLSERTLLFVAPTAFILVVAGLEAAVQLTARRIPTARGPTLATLGALLLLPATLDGAVRLRDVIRPDPFKAAVTDLTHQAGSNASVYVFSRDVPIWTFYTTDWRSPDTARVRLLTAAAASQGPNSGNMPGRGHAVEREGEGLVVRTSGRNELIGVPTGMQARFADVSQQTPDPGWATNEAARIRAAANPVAWIFFTYCHNMCDATLIDTLTAGGGRIAYRRAVRGARIYEYRRD